MEGEMRKLLAAAGVAITTAFLAFIFWQSAMNSTDAAATRIKPTYSVAGALCPFRTSNLSIDLSRNADWLAHAVGGTCSRSPLLQRGERIKALRGLLWPLTRERGRFTRRAPVSHGWPELFVFYWCDWNRFVRERCLPPRWASAAQWTG